MLGTAKASHPSRVSGNTAVPLPGDLDTLDVNVPGFPAITGVPVA